MARYTHSFDTRIDIQFESDIEDFDEALKAKLDSLPDDAARRAFLTTSDEGVSYMIGGVIWSQTDDNGNECYDGPEMGSEDTHADNGPSDPRD